MHRLILIFTTLVALTALTGCTKPQFHVEASLRGGDGRNIRFIYLAAGKKQAFMMDQAAPVMDGKLKFDGVTARPTIVTVCAPDMSALTEFYAEPGDKITITGEMADPAGWLIGGNKINEEWTAWRKKNSAALKSRKPLEINKAVEAYVKKNPGNPLSTILLLCVYSRHDDEAGFQRLFASLEEGARPERLMEAIGRVDAGIKYKPLSFKELGWRTLGDSIDSIAKIRPSHHNATLIYFNDRETARANDLSALRPLRRELSDSALALVDLYLGPDTIGLGSRLATDSLKGITRSWAFGGLMHPTVERLGVPTIPYFIVLDSKGRQTYRGTSAEGAAKEVRKLQKDAKK